jgi:hypothetical protein
MVFEVLGTTEPPRLVTEAGSDELAQSAATSDVKAQVDGETAVAAPEVAPTVKVPARSLPEGVISQLLRSAVALQAEGLLRAAGALSGAWGGVLDRTEWIERDARDLAALAAAANEANVALPAGVDAGAGDPDHPSSVVEGMLAAHEALVGVLRQLTRAGGDAQARPWLGLISTILSRREEQITLLRAVGAAGHLPEEQSYVHGRPPRHR